MKIKKLANFINKNKFYLIFLLIVLIGMYLRFYKIDDYKTFGWDQARDAWKVRDIIKGQIVLIGPRTGVGQFHLGPFWYYLLAPFYLLTRMDPDAANYLNMLVNLFNFAVIFTVTKKIYDKNIALFASFFYATNRYLIELNRVPWNVSLIPGIALLIFYAIYKVVYEKKYKWILILSFLVGLFFHLHFSVVFLPLIVFLSFILAKDKKRTLIWIIIGLPLLFVWFIPNVLYDIQTKNNNLRLFSNFLKDYLIKGFHFRFFLHRLNDAFIQFKTILSLPSTYKFLKFVIPSVFSIVVFFDKDKKQKILSYLILLWFLVPAIGYSFYGGLTSEYYMLMNSILVIYILAYLQRRILQIKFKQIILLSTIFWTFFTYVQTKNLWIKIPDRGLDVQKEYVRSRMRDNNKIEYKEGEIESYLWQIWVEDKK
ncbi:MAG: glycosyltransferase family 39 protein [Patescibacteria group bacterium]